MATPEFEMPWPRRARGGRERGEAPRRPEADAGRDAGADANADAGADARPRRRFGWRHLAAAVLIGGILGAAVPAGLRLAGGAASSDRAESLEQLAGEYLEAIADGDAFRATELSPLGTGLVVAADAALGSASRLEPVEAGPAYVDGDRGSVDVRYRVGGAELQRSLRASLTPAGWRLATSLAEAPDTSANEPPTVLRVGGVALRGNAEPHLYPGVYRLDVVEGPLFAWGGDAFTIDGDPATVTPVRAARELMPSFAEQLTSIGLDMIAACLERPDCPIRTDFRFELSSEAVVLQTLDDGRTIDLKVPLVARDPAGNEWRDVIVRVTLDSRGLPVAWLCSSPGRGALQPCEP